MSLLLHQGWLRVVITKMIILFLSSGANLGFAFIANFWRNCRVVQGFPIRCCIWSVSIRSDWLTIDYQMVIRALKARLRITEFPTKEGKELVVPLTLPLFPPALLRLECCSEFRLGNSFLKALLILSDADLLPKHQKSYVSFIKKIV